MITLINFACCLFILFHFPSCSFSYTFNGYEIRDLEGDSSCFLSQVSLWTASRTKTSITYSICNGTYLLGGYDILGTLSSPAWYEDNFKKSYSSLPTTHTMIYFSLTVYALDNWGNGTNTNDTFALDFDTKRVVGPFLKQTNFPTDMCARAGYNDLGPIKVMGRVLHSGSTLTLKLVDMLAQDSNNESVAFRDVNLLFSATTTTETSCSRASISFTGSCPCPAGQFLFSTNNCVACHPNCAECFGSGADQCYQCAAGSSWVSGSCANCDASCRVCNGPGSSQCNACPQGLFYFQSKQCIPECPPPFTQVVNVCGNTCNSPCSGSNFLFANNTCLPSCPFPLQTTTVYTTVNKCINPCTYGEYLFWDGTCKTSCIAPLKIRSESGVNYCDYNCNSNQYLYWNGSCSTICAPPLVQRFDKSRQFCVYPCQSQEYLYYNGSCLASCPLPFISQTTNNKNFCYYPCPDPSNYIYWNNTCLSSCPSPLNPYLLNGIKYCSKSCPKNQYLFWNDSCIDSCDPPLRLTTYQNQVQRCLYPCSNPLEFYDDSTGLCKTTCETHPTNEGGLYLRCPPTKYSLLVDLLLAAPLKQGAGSFVVLTKLTQHVKYMNATFSPRLQDIVASKGRPIISLRLGMSMPDSLQRHFTEYTLPDVFESANLHSSFLVNYWQELTSILIVVGLSLLNMLINLLSRKYRCQRLESFSNKVKFIPTWNYLLMLFATGLDDIILFSALEFQTFHLDSVLGFVSFIVCLIMLVIAVGMLTIFFIFAAKAQTARFETQSNRLLVSYKLFVARWQAFQVLFRGFNTENYFDYLFFFFYTIRLFFPSIIYSSSYSSPVLEAIVYLLISVIILAYVIYLKPIVDKINHIQLLITEAIVLFMNIILLILAAQGPTATLDSAIIYLGDAIILSNVCLNLITVVFLVIKLSYQVKEAISLRKQGSDKEMEAWTKALFIFVQQGGMGFEQAEYIDFANKNPMAIHIQGSLIDNLSLQKNSSDQLAVSEENGFNEIQIEDIKLTQNMNEEIVMFMSPDSSVNAVTPNETMINQQNQGSVEPEDVDRLDRLQR